MLMTRAEAFEEMLGVIARLQREGALSFEQVQELNSAVCRYGMASALDAIRTVRAEAAR